MKCFPHFLAFFITKHLLKNSVCPFLHLCFLVYCIIFQTLTSYFFLFATYGCRHPCCSHKSNALKIDRPSLLYTGYSLV